LNATTTSPAGQAILYSLSLPSGVALVGDGSGGDRLRAKCVIPEEAIPELALVDPRLVDPSSSRAADNVRREGRPVDQPAAQAATTNTGNAPVEDPRFAELAAASNDIASQVRAKKIGHQQAARLYRQKILTLFPEQAKNPFANEYLAYSEVVGEKVDHKKLTEAEAQYELTRKMSELQERQAHMQAEMAAAQTAADQKAAQEAAAKRVSEEASAKKAADEGTAQHTTEVAEQRLAVERQMLEQQQQMRQQQRVEYLEKQQRLADKQRQENLAALLRLLTPPRLPVTNCFGTWSGQTWVSNCTSH
jgi:hypothetical protein